MNTSKQMVSDEQLWERSSRGDREAFGQIVERYQSLVCSLAYSSCGDLARSEDLAQETFIAAWNKLGELREPGKLRAWLCGIVRNRAANASRREQRRGGPPESLEFVSERPSLDLTPAQEAVTNEESALLWKSLSSLPENYREPMVLFYRERHSIAQVALGLDLSEEAVKQRLSRGRSMLREEMTALVESTLTRTRPKAAFTLGVLAALPLAATPASAAITGAGAAGKGAAAVAKGGIGSLGLGVLAGPAIGLLIGWFSSKAAALTSRSEQERKCLLRHARQMVVFCFVMSLGLAGLLSQAGKMRAASAGWILGGVLAWVTALLAVILLRSPQVNKNIEQIREETHTDDDAYAKKLKAFGLGKTGPKRFESKLRFLGIPLVALASGGLEAGAYRSQKSIGWIAFGDYALSPLLAIGGVAVAPIALGGITFGFISLSFWGIAIGALATGSLALGWWSFGMGAVGWKSAAGIVAVSHEYAVGVIARANEANTTEAKNWITRQWFTDIVGIFAPQAHWWILFFGLAALGVVLKRAWQLRRAR